MQQTVREERSFRTLFTDLAQEITDLIRQELTLARVEMSEKVSKMGSGIGEVVAGALIAYAGFLAVVGALSIGLYLLIADWPGAAWLAPLIVGLVVMLAGYLTYLAGRSNVRARNLTPERTINTLRGNAAFAREQTR